MSKSNSIVTDINRLLVYCDNKFHTRDISVLDCLKTLEYYVKKSKSNKELTENLNEYIKYMKESSEVNKNKLK